MNNENINNFLMNIITCSSNFTNTTSWAKQLGAILPSLLLKIEGGGAI
jgi:hypothetical protein